MTHPGIGILGGGGGVCGERVSKQADSPTTTQDAYARMRHLKFYPTPKLVLKMHMCIEDFLLRITFYIIYPNI